MAEKITIEELKMFIGTGLKFNDGEHMVGLNDFGEVELSDDEVYSISYIGTGTKPLVRPLSQITEVIEIKGERLVPIYELAKENGVMVLSPLANNTVISLIDLQPEPVK